MTPTVKYAGDHTATYRQSDDTGLIGKVLGPNAMHQWFVVTEASYDPETDTTYATAELLRSPAALLEDR